MTNMCLNCVTCLTGQLNSLGVIKHFADVVGGKLVAINLGWQAVFGLLNVCYFALHYMFASQTAHVEALYSALLALMLAAGEASVPRATWHRCLCTDSNVGP